MSRLLPIITYFVVSAVLACASYVSANASAGARKFRDVILANSGGSPVVGYQFDAGIQFKVKIAQSDQEPKSRDQTDANHNLSNNYDIEDVLKSAFEFSSPVMVDGGSSKPYSLNINSWINLLSSHFQSPAFDVYQVTDKRSNPSTGPPSQYN